MFDLPTSIEALEANGMRASKTPMERLIDYSASNLKFDGSVALRKAIARYVRGVRGERKNGVTETQIVKWFRGTPKAFVLDRLKEADVRCCMRSLSSGRRHNGGYLYTATSHDTPA